MNIKSSKELVNNANETIITMSPEQVKTAYDKGGFQKAAPETARQYFFPRPKHSLRTDIEAPTLDKKSVIFKKV